MANTLTDLIPDMYEALDVVSREMTGMIAAVNRDSNASQAALNQSVRVPITADATTADTTPGVTAPDTGDEVTDNVEIKITKSKHVAIRFNGEETRGLQNAGTYSNIRAERIAQAMRALCNEMEADLWAAAYKGASRAYGTAGTAPFGTANDLSDFAGVLRILEENGAPRSDLQLALGHAAVANLRGKQSVLFKTNEAGSSDMLRNGVTDRIMGFAIRPSDPITVHTKGTGTGYLINGAEAAGQSTLTVDGGTAGDTGILAGDIITAAGDSNKYVVNTGRADAAGDIVIGKPGLQAAAADNTALTIGNSYTPNVAFSRSAVILATRAPEKPEGGDSAVDVVQVTDPVTGIVFEVARYPQFMQAATHVRLAWGVKAIKPNHIATLIG